MERPTHKDTFTIELYSFNGPENVNGMTVKSDQSPDLYRIMLNDRNEPGRNVATFLHEMLHIYNKDFDAEESAGEIEARTEQQLLDALEFLRADMAGQS